MKDYYVLLGVKPNASNAQIDAAYRRLMQKYHPNARSSPQTLDRMRELNQAWRVLTDPAQRAAYDRARLDGSNFQPQTAQVTARTAAPTVNAEFGAPRARGGSCLVRLGVAVVLFFALGILLWGLNEQLNFGAMVDRMRNDFIQSLMPNAFAPTQAAQAQITPTPDPRCRGGCETPPPGCIVKGDVEANGARFFYLPNDAGYNGIRIDISQGDRWFCASGDAQAAGWTRKAPTETPPLAPPPDAVTTQTAHKKFVVCVDTAALFQGPGTEYALVQNLEPGANVVVTGVNGEWSVVAIETGVAYIPSAMLCAPTRAPAATRAPNNNATGETPSAARTAAAIANPASVFKYPAPRLVMPTNGARYWCMRELAFEWALDAAPLAGDEFFLIESKPQEQTRWAALADWTQETRVTLYPNRGGGACDTVWWANTGAYQWRVSVVRGSKEMPEYLSPFSPVYDITYAQ